MRKNYDARKVPIGTQRRPPQQPDDYVPLGQNRILRVRHRSLEILQNREMFETSLRGIRPGKGVSVCHNHIQTRTEMENLLAHELIHAYDDCTRRKMDWMDVRHHACSEVRAANLSGDCHWCVRCCWCCCCCYAFARTRSFWRIVFLLSTRLLLSFERRLIITLSSSFLRVHVCVCVCY